MTVNSYCFIYLKFSYDAISAVIVNVMHVCILHCSHRKKRMRQLQKKARSGKLDLKEDDPFELFVAATNIRYCYYSETHKVLGNTYGMCVLQVGWSNYGYLFAWAEY